MKECLCDILDPCIYVLDPLGSDVLALPELKDALPSVDDPEGAIGQQHSDIPRVVPPF